MTTDPSSAFATLEEEIAGTRASLNRKIDEIERRLTPAHIKAQVRQKLDPESYTVWLALGAVALGVLIAVRSWPRQRVTDAQLGYSVPS
jgi:Protein of unknown function (DUF3618)